MQLAGDVPGSDEYELLVERLVGQLSQWAGVRTERIKRDVPVQGRATRNQIDVLWDLTDAAGQARRIVFEARSYRNRIKQGALHAFRSVVDDIQDPDRPVLGVMVTTTGYQRGATNVASTYDVVVLELRAPTSIDLRSRVAKVQIMVEAVRTVVEQVRFEAVEVYDEAASTSRQVLQDLFVVPADGNPRSLMSLLVDGELGPLGSPRAVHGVRREFRPPADLLVAGRRIASLVAVTAQVGEIPASPFAIKVDGPKNVAWMLRDALTGARAWIADNGQVWSTQD